jgi:hypothetical protein
MTQRAGNLLHRFMLEIPSVNLNASLFDADFYYIRIGNHGYQGPGYHAIF